MRGYIGNTDFDWYTSLLGLSRSGPLDEVNFWQPSGARGFHAVQPGEPFFFKLKSPHYAVAGFGFFGGAHALDASMAWEWFREKNGAATFAEMRERIGRYRARPIGPGEDPTIGCLLIQQPVFFERPLWVEQPAGWPKNVVQGKTYDLEEGEGRALWEKCRLASGGLRAEGVPLVSDVGAGATAARFGAPVEVRPRLGQGTFRAVILDAYGRACAVTGEHSVPVLEAAHIKPYGSGGEHDPQNGLLLRSDLHRLFDKGFVTVTPELAFKVSPLLKGRWANGKVYYELHGRTVREPAAKALKPDRDLLAWHGREVFLAG